MNGAVIKYGLIGLAVVGYLGYTSLQGSKPKPADLGNVLDRTDYALANYQVSNEEEKVDEAEMELFTGYLTDVMNAQPVFYDKPIGMTLGSDAVFTGFDDVNANRVRDAGENSIFTVEVDVENERLIATDVSGNSVHHRYSGSGFVTGLLIGRLLSRQSASGIRRGSFNNRRTTSRTSYSGARSRSRSGGSRSGK